MKTESETPSRSGSRAVRILKVIGVVILLLISLLILVLVHESWSGAREWSRVEKKLIEGGVELDPLKLVREAPPADRNFGAHPLLISLIQFEKGEDGELVYDDPEKVEEIRKLVAPRGPEGDYFAADWLTRERTDFESLAEVLELEGDPVESIVAWIRSHEPTIAELDRAAQRPEAVYPLSVEGTFIEQVTMELPYVQDFMNLARFQALRACAELKAGSEGEARKALHTLHQLGKVSDSQPLLISHLVGVSIHNFEMSAIWYGLREDLWSEESLAWIQSRLAGEPDRFVANLEKALNFELCVFIIGGMDFLKAVNSGESPEGLGELLGTGDRASYGYSLIPDGIWDHNKAFAAEWIYESSLGPLSRGEIGNGEMEKDLGAQVRIGGFPAPRRFMAGIMVPAVSSVAKRSFSAATIVDFARVSCGLELYRKREGSYPESLAALVPRDLEAVPEDRLSPSDEPIRYRREGNRYLLYSVGQNQTDEKGEVAFRNGSNTRINRDKGDLVWGFTDFESLPEGE